MLELLHASTSFTGSRALSVHGALSSRLPLRHASPLLEITSTELLKDSLGARVMRFIDDPLPPPGTLILLRHGQSEMTEGKPPTFVGWSDPDLSESGEKQALEAARAIKEAGYTFDVTYCSMLKRAVRTTWLLLQYLECIHLPCWKTWRLNERCCERACATRARRPCVLCERVRREHQRRRLECARHVARALR